MLGNSAGFEKHGLTLLHLKDECCSPQRMSKETGLAVDALNLLYEQDRGCVTSPYITEALSENLPLGRFQDKDKEMGFATLSYRENAMMCHAPGVSGKGRFNGPEVALKVGV